MNNVKTPTRQKADPAELERYQLDVLEEMMKDISSYAQSFIYKSADRDLRLANWIIDVALLAVQSALDTRKEIRPS